MEKTGRAPLLSFMLAVAALLDGMGAQSQAATLHHRADELRRRQRARGQAEGRQQLLGLAERAPGKTTRQRAVQHHGRNHPGRSCRRPAFSGLSLTARGASVIRRPPAWQ